MFRARIMGLALLLLAVGSRQGSPQELVHFTSLAQPPVQLNAYLYRPAGEGRHPAVVFLHGCGGLILRASGQINRREQAWAAELVNRGHAVLMVDSFRPRGITEMCSPASYEQAIVMQRPKDAYAALYFLQSQPFVRGDRVALMGWSQGGGTVLWSIPQQSLGRPAALPQGDFRAAVGFYPASCSVQRQGPAWTTNIPLMVLTGAEDVWTPSAPCQAFLQAATARGARIDELQVYPGAYHDFDAPDLPRREYPQYRTSSGVVPILATDQAARADAIARVVGFLARHLAN